jgi:hypothetical protein
MVIGPFDNPNNTGLSVAFPPEKEFNLLAEYPGKTGLVKWRRADDGREDGRLNFAKLFTSTDRTVAYAAVEVTSPEERTVQLRIGSDDQVKVWLNGEVVWTFCVTSARLRDRAGAESLSSAATRRSRPSDEITRIILIST